MLNKNIESISNSNIVLKLNYCALVQMFHRKMLNKVLGCCYREVYVGKEDLYNQLIQTSRKKWVITQSFQTIKGIPEKWDPVPWEDQDPGPYEDPGPMRTQDPVRIQDLMKTQDPMRTQDPRTTQDSMRTQNSLMIQKRPRNL